MFDIKFSRKFIIIFFLMGAAVFLFMYIGSKETTDTKPFDLTTLNSVQPKKSLKVNYPEQKYDSVLFINSLISESKKISSINANPSEHERYLAEWSNSLDSNELNELKSIILSTDQDSDLRMLSAYLLSKHSSIDAIVIAEQILKQPIEKKTNQTQFEFEQGLKTICMDAIIDNSNKEVSIQALNRIKPYVIKNPFLRDRIDRAVHYLLNDNIKSPAQQETEALKQVIENR